MRASVRGLILALFLFATLSCGEPVGLADGVRIVTTRDAIFLTNGSEQGSLFATVIREDLVPLVDWLPCITPGSCGEVLPGATRKITADALGARPGDAVRVYWWRAVPGIDDAPVVGPISSERVRFRPRFAP